MLPGALHKRSGAGLAFLNSCRSLSKARVVSEESKEQMARQRGGRGILALNYTNNVDMFKIIAPLPDLSEAINPLREGVARQGWASPTRPLEKMALF